MQLRLFQDDQLPRPRFVENVNPQLCDISRYNPRKTRNQDSIDNIKTQMQAIGFKPDRALYAYANNGRYEVFAGGNRLHAARELGIDVCLWLCECWTPEQISRFAHEDNVSDGLHVAVMPMDEWAEMARLRDEEGWTQQKIADARGINQASVSRKLQYHDNVPQTIKVLCGTEITEEHLKVVFDNYVVPHITLASWCNTDIWRVEVLQWAIDKKKSSRETGKQWQSCMDAVKRADELIGMIPEDRQDEYIFNDDKLVRNSIDWRECFVVELAELKARSTADVDSIFKTIVDRQQQSNKRKADYDAGVEQSQAKAKEEARRIEAISERWLQGDCLELIAQAPDNIRLVLTDPPYGIDFESNRRVASAKAGKIAGDDADESALALFAEMIDRLMPKLAQDAHLLIFTHWRTEYQFRQVLTSHGFYIRGSLIWVKDNHTSGDLRGAFAPKHERIIHATWGNPEISPRKPDVFSCARTGESGHPTEKPVELLMELIKCTTRAGDIVIDPFGGVASTLYAAKQLMNREWWGCELSQEWWSIGFERLKG